MNSQPLAPRLYIGLAVLLLIGVFFRFYNLDKKLFWMDESASALRISGYTDAELDSQTKSRRLWTPAELNAFQRVQPGRTLGDAVRSMAIDDPQHPPLFYGMLRLWSEAFGDSVFALRLLPALLSLLIFPASWFLCRELFYDDPMVRQFSFVVLSVMAISPFHVLYAQEAREYSLMAALLLASTALLLWALRAGGLWRWAAYALGLAFGFYTHTLFVLMWLAHCLAVLALFWHDRKTVGAQNAAPSQRRYLLAFAGASLCAVLLFAPWALMVWKGRAHSADNWTSADSSPWYVMKTWMLMFSSLFFDPNQTQRWIGAGRADFLLVPAVRFARIVVFGMVLFALGFVWRKAPRRIAYVICAIAFLPFAALAAPDLLLGGFRSTIARFMIVSFIGVQLAAAYWITAKLAAPRTRRLGLAVFGLLVMSGIGSCWMSSQATLWWNKASSYEVPNIVRTLNSRSRPLLVTRMSNNVFSINRLLKPTARIYFLRKEDEKNFDPAQVAFANADSVFFFNPSKTLRATLQKRGALLEKANGGQSLWRLKSGGSNVPALSR